MDQLVKKHTDAEIRKALIADIAKRGGLRIGTVNDLLDAGWSYVENIDCTPRWVHPSANLQEKNK